MPGKFPTLNLDPPPKCVTSDVHKYKEQQESMTLVPNHETRLKVLLKTTWILNKYNFFWLSGLQPFQISAHKDYKNKRKKMEIFDSAVTSWKPLHVRSAKMDEMCRNIPSDVCATNNDMIIFQFLRGIMRCFRYI